jgi:sugar lactone lactonase YvrE
VTLREVLDAAAAQYGLDVRVATVDDGSVTWSRGDQVFAIVSADGATASFLLDPLVAGAAARTPDVRASSRGRGWVDLSPRAVDGHAADRAGAWFLSAHRRLAGSSG